MRLWERVWGSVSLVLSFALAYAVYYSKGWAGLSILLAALIAIHFLHKRKTGNWLT